MGWGGGLLHSHVQTFPVGSNQQQVTCYHYKDENNEWVVMPRWDEAPYDPNGPLRFLKDGDAIRAVIRGSGVNQDGRTPGMTLPSKTAQEALIRSVYGASGLDLAETD